AVRVCQGGDRPLETRLFSILLISKPQPGTTPGTAGDPPTQDTPTTECARGDFTAPLGAVGTNSISFTSNGAEGLKTFSVSVTSETVITKQDATVTLGGLAAGDKVHVYVIRCP